MTATIYENGDSNDDVWKNLSSISFNYAFDELKLKVSNNIQSRKANKRKIRIRDWFEKRWKLR